MNALRLVLLNAAAWATVHLTVAFLAVHSPARWYKGWSSATRINPRKRVLYRCLGIRHWKSLLPDGAVWVGGDFRKKSLGDTNPAHLRDFLRETRRAEAAHWVVIACTGLFFPWNPVFAWPILCAYAIAANVPCIVVQRYNRARLEILLRDHSSATAV